MRAGTADAYSDIDVVVVFPATDAQVASSQVVQAIESAFSVLFHDWATSLLPEQIIVSFFLSDVPLFRHVDVEIEVAPEHRNLTPQEAVNDEVGHALKLWIVTCKHVIRNDPRTQPELDNLWSRSFPGQTMPDSSFQALSSLLNAIPPTERLATFLARCHEVLAAIEGI